MAILFALLQEGSFRESSGGRARISRHFAGGRAKEKNLSWWREKSREKWKP
jgi:hypothetical protein